MTPIALSKGGVPDTEVPVMDEFSLHGLGLHDDYESWSRYQGYVWSGWTTRKAQPMHIDSALQALIDQSVQADPNAMNSTYIGRDLGTPAPTTESKGSQSPVCESEPPFPTSVPDVSMQQSADKRSRDSPDSTLKPEHKSLKTSGVAVATDEEPINEDTSAAAASAASQSDIEPQIIRWNVREKTDVRPTMWQFHHSSPAWKVKTCIDAMKVRPIDLSSLVQETGVKFASVELVELAVGCLDEITAEIKKDESTDSCTASSSRNQKVDEDDASQKATPGSTATSTEGQTSGDQSTSTDTAAPKSVSTTKVMPTQQQDAVASKEKTKVRDHGEPVAEKPKAWVDRVVNAGHGILWPQSTTLSLGPTPRGRPDGLGTQIGECQSRQSHPVPSRHAQLTASNHPMEATAWENGFVPEAQGTPSDQLDQRIPGLLPPFAFMGIQTETTNCGW